MDCREIDKLLVKISSETITDEETDILLSHIADCNSCRYKFEEIAESLTLNTYEIPNNFQSEVMKKINEELILDETDNKICTLWSAFSVLVGSIMIIIINRIEILAYLRTHPFLKEFSLYFIKITNSIYSVTDNLSNFITSIISDLNFYAENLKYASLLACFILVVAQFLLYKKENMET